MTRRTRIAIWIMLAACPLASAAPDTPKPTEEGEPPPAPPTTTPTSPPPPASPTPPPTTTSPTPPTTPTAPPPTAPPPSTTPPAAPATPGTEEPEENLLANINGDEDPNTKQLDTSKSFGTTLRFFGIETNWSGYGDFVVEAVPHEKELTFDASHFNSVFSVRMSDTLSGELELEFEHGGGEINVEYAMVDWAPFEGREFVVRTGKFLVPVGRFNEQLHPSFRWLQIGRPLMMNEVIPVEWSDVGIQVRGQVKRGTVAFDYAMFAVNGLGEHPGAEGEGEVDEEGEEGGFIRGLRSNQLDSNYDKGLGGRAALTSGTGHNAVSLGLSGYTGRVSALGDAAGPERLTIIDVDLHARQGGLVINGELAQTFFGSKSNGYFQKFERGAYLQLGYTFGKTTIAARYDYETTGVQDEGLVGALEDHQAGALTLKYAPAPSWSVRAEVVQPLSPSDETDNTAFAAAITFVF